MPLRGRRLLLRLRELPWWARPLLVLLYLLSAAAIALTAAFALYGVSTTLAWQHVIGSRVTVVVMDCRDAGRNGAFCVGTRTGGAHPGDRVHRLPYDPASIGRSETVWAWAGDAVVGTPWSALWCDSLTLAAVAYAGRRLLSRRRGAAR